MPRVQPSYAAHRRHAGGVTLVEMMVVVAIAVVLAAIALPSMQQFVARKRVEGVANELLTDLRSVKSYQVQSRSNTGTGIRINSSNTDFTCYAIYTVGTVLATCRCEADPPCGADDQVGKARLIRLVKVERSTGVTIASNRAELRMIGYNALPRNGLTATITVESAIGGSIRISTNAAGTPFMCSVSGSFGQIRPC